MKNFCLYIIKFYQMFISPQLGENCRFYPSCSEYSFQAIKKYGTIQGFSMGVKRIFKCSFWNKGGIDIP